MKIFINFLFLMFPLLMILMPLPLIMGFPPFYPRSITEFDLTITAILILYYLGLFAYPGYIYLLFYKRKYILLSEIKCLWIRVSFWAAIASSIGGVFLGYMLPFFSLIGIVTVLMCFQLLISFEGRRRTGEERARHKMGTGR
jgi:hypothetical protein